MLITKFNKMIRNKMLWWFFAIVVTVSFVGVYSGYSKYGDNTHTQDAAGKLYGKEISRQTLDRAMFHTMRLRNYRNQSDENMRIIRHEAWKRLAALETASKLGISATMNELIASIGRDPNFQADGAFSKEKYRAVIESQMQVPVEQFEDFLREEIVLQKLGTVMESCVWTAPSELNQRLTRVTDRLSIRYAVFTMPTNATSVTVGKNEAGKYFDKNIEQFRVPEKITVKYVKFPAEAYLAKVQISEPEMKLYYTNNMDKFVSADTNATTSKPYGDVKQEISSILQHEKAITEAKDRAARFATSLIPDHKGRAPTFEEAAGKSDLTISTSASFSAYEEVPGMKVDRDFNRAGFDLDPSDKEHYFSDPVECKDAVYVLAAGERKPSHLPVFNDVEKDATLMAQREADENAFTKKCNEARDSARKVVKTGLNFEEFFKNAGATVSTNISFSAYEAASDPFEYFDVILSKVMHMTKGDLTEPLEVNNGMIVIYLADKEPGKPGAVEAVRPEMINVIDRSLTTAVYNDWREYLLKKSGFVDTSPAPAMTAEDAVPEEEQTTNDI